MKYFFNLRSEDGVEPDEQGLELGSLAEAEEEARRAAREMISELVLRDEEIDGRTFEIADERGDVVSAIPFRNLLKL